MEPNGNSDESNKSDTQAEESREAVRQRLQDYMIAYNTGDVKNVAAFYAKDSYFVAPERNFIRGPEGFLKCGIIKQMMDLGGKRLEIKEADSVASNNSVSVVAYFYLYDESGKEIDDGRLVNVWVKVGDEWFLKYDIFN